MGTIEGLRPKDIVLVNVAEGGSRGLVLLELVKFRVELTIVGDCWSARYLREHRGILELVWNDGLVNGYMTIIRKVRVKEDGTLY